MGGSRGIKAGASLRQTLQSVVGRLAGFAGAAILASLPVCAAAPMLSFTATTDNVTGAHDSIRIDLIRWSTDAERDQLLSAWMNPAPPAAARGGRGGRGGAGAAAARATPESSLGEALDKGPTVGYLWSSEVAGYALHYALRLPQENGGERIVLITDRRLGDSNDLWKPTVAGATGESAANYPFTLIELRLNAKEEGEGKISGPGKVAADAADKTLVLENYSALPLVLRNVKRRASSN
jgi:hypothetical protein